MTSIDVVVSHPAGLHARPAAQFVEEAGRFASRITVENLDRVSRPVDAKSILMLMTIGVSQGHRIRITADGEDEEQAIVALSRFVAAGRAEQPLA